MEDTTIWAYTSEIYIFISATVLTSYNINNYYCVLNCVIQECGSIAWPEENDSYVLYYQNSLPHVRGKTLSSAVGFGFIMMIRFHMQKFSSCYDKTYT